MLALWLEHHLTKEEILVRYLNTAYFGAGVYGADAAAKRYFGKSAKELSLRESAMLAGLVRAPSALAPHRNLEGARERAETRARRHGRDRCADPGSRPMPRAGSRRNFRVPPEAPPGTNYFVDTLECRSEAAGRRGARRSARRDHARSRAAAPRRERRRQAARRRKARARRPGRRRWSRWRRTAPFSPWSAAAIMTRASSTAPTQAKRQPGSLFKLFVYLAALQKGLQPAHVMLDRPIQIGDWEPENYGRRFHGPVTLRTAFARSLNIVAVQVADEVGIKGVIDVRETARRAIRAAGGAQPRARFRRGDPDRDDPRLCRHRRQCGKPRALFRSHDPKGRTSLYLLVRNRCRQPARDQAARGGHARASGPASSAREQAERPGSRARCRKDGNHPGDTGTRGSWVSHATSSWECGSATTTTLRPGA